MEGRDEVIRINARKGNPYLVNPHFVFDLTEKDTICGDFRYGLTKFQGSFEGCAFIDRQDVV